LKSLFIDDRHVDGWTGGNRIGVDLIVFFITTSILFVMILDQLLNVRSALPANLIVVIV